MTFETSDVLSLTVLSLSCGTADRILKDFNSLKWWGRTLNALAYLPVSKMNVESIGLTSSSHDALYVNRNKNGKLALLYVTPHLIFYHYDTGMSTLDSLYRGPLNFESVAVTPTFKFRSFDNKSVEFVAMGEGGEAAQRNEEEQVDLEYPSNRYRRPNPHQETHQQVLKSITHPTLGLFCERTNGRDNNNFLTVFHSFIDNVRDFFDKTMYIPYIIHPYRLLLYENNYIELISCNLLLYAFHPHVPSWKIRDAIFSHPMTMTNTDTLSTIPFGKDNNIAISRTTTDTVRTDVAVTEDKLNSDTVNLVLDFFYSTFTTTLFLYNNKLPSRNLTNIRQTYQQYQQQLFGNNLPASIHRPRQMRRRKNTHILINNRGNNLKSNNNDNTTSHFPITTSYSTPTLSSLSSSLSSSSPSSSSSSVSSSSLWMQHHNPREYNAITPILCQNYYGFCHAFHDTAAFNPIHEYGCNHLLSFAPIVLSSAIREANTNGDKGLFRDCVIREMFVLQKFISLILHIKNNENNNSDV